MPRGDDGEDASEKTRTSKRPPFRPTMEVQMSWLDTDDEATTSRSVNEPATPPSSRKRPPRLPGATRTLPPMPLVPTMPSLQPPRRNTIEVETSWLEPADDERGAGAEESAENAPERRSARPLANDDPHALAQAATVPAIHVPPRTRSSRDDTLARAPTVRPSRPPTSRPAPVEELLKPRAKRGKPIPRED